MKFLSQNRPVSTDLYAGEKSYENGRPTVGLSPNNNRLVANLYFSVAMF
jgi:hypothetical protein